MAVAASGAEAIVNFAAETHVDRSIAQPDAFVRPTRSAPTCCWRPRASTPCATCRCQPTRSTARSRRAPSPSRARWRRPRRTRRRRPAPTCSCRATTAPTDSTCAICRGSNNYGPYQYPEKLIPLMILNARPRRRRCRSTATACRCATGSTAATSRRRSGFVLEHGASGRGLQRRRPRRGGQHRRGTHDHRADRRAPSRRSSTSPTGPATIAATRSPRRRCARSAGSPRVRFVEGLEQTVAWYRENPLVVGADPLRATTAPTTSASTAAP